MKVLMMGQEFPPTIPGGLATAFYGLTKGLSIMKKVEGSFPGPMVFGGEDKSNSKLIGAREVSACHPKVNLNIFNHCAEFT